jgi:tetratricopeptide (TPR) repeat protein
MPDQFSNEPFDDSLPPDHEPDRESGADYVSDADANGLDDSIVHMPVPEFVAPLIDEPPVAPDDTQPRAPVSVHERLSAEEPPFDPVADTAETPVLFPASGRWLLVLAVFAGTLCLCALMIGSAAFLGYRDGLATNDAKVTQTLATGIAEQYATGVVDLAQGYSELAVARFEWIVETIQAPTEYAQDSAMRLAIARTRAAYTATPQAAVTAAASSTPAESTPTGTPTTEAATATLSPLEDPDYLYRQAEIAAGLARYEEAIEWLDALFALAPDYARAAEAKAMLMHALTEQGKIYLRGQNEDGEDMLLRGVQLIYRAQDLGEIPGTLLGEAIFVESYVNARSYVNGGNYAAALPILQDLCNQNCSWGYPNVNPVTVRDLLDIAQSGGSQ